MIFGNRLKALREARGLSRKAFAEAMGVSYSTISKYENGERFPDLDLLRKFAVYFNVSADYLIGITPIPSAIAGERELRSANISNDSKDNIDTGFAAIPRPSVLKQLSQTERQTYLELCRESGSPFTGDHSIKTNDAQVLPDEVIISLVRFYKMMQRKSTSNNPTSGDPDDR